jgi:Ca2+-transporting ATPase
MFMTAVSLAAAAIPEGLPAVSTIVLAIGVQRLVKKNAIVRKLPSVETLGSTQVICSDKTGTLTQNKMTVVKMVAHGKIIDIADSMSNLSASVATTEGLQIIRIAILANDAKLSENADTYTTTGDPTETALIDLGLKFGFNKNLLEEEHPRIEEIPFDSERKLMTTVHHLDESYNVVYTKGGLDELLACCSRIAEDGNVVALTEERKASIRQTNIQLAANALRVLAMGYKRIEKGTPVEREHLEEELIFSGMVGMIDPPREEVKLAVEKCRAAGIKPVMITGDHKITAIAIAESLGIKQENDRALTGMDVEQLSEEALRESVDSISVYARVSPEHKVRIVKAFQENGKIVAMTGDGVNDAPALKLADIGVAMGITGTDVSKEAADVVLTDDNFATIVSAVEEGRRIYDNILKAIQFMLSTNIGEILVLFIAVMANWISPLLPIHILWINLVTDSLPALALSVDPAEENIMQRQPIDSRKGIMTKSFFWRMFLQGIMIAALTLGAYHIGLQTSVPAAQTMTFAVLALSQITIVFSIRNGRRSAFKGMFSNKYLLGAVVIVVAMMLVVLEVPALHTLFHLTKLSSAQWGWVAGLSLAPLLITEIVKLWVHFASVYLNIHPKNVSKTNHK